MGTVFQNWRHLLLKQGLEDVHLKRIWGEAKRRGWDLPKLNDVLLEFIGAIKDANLIGFGVAYEAPLGRFGRKAAYPALDRTYCCVTLRRDGLRRPGVLERSES